MFPALFGIRCVSAMREERFVRRGGSEKKRASSRDEKSFRRRFQIADDRMHDTVNKVEKTAVCRWQVRRD